MNGNGNAGLTPDLRRAVVDLGGHAELVVARAFGHRRGRPHRDQGAGKMRGEVHPAAGVLQIGGDPAGFGEAAVGAVGEGHQRQSRVVEAAREIGRAAGV